jgi:spermidine/putrescine transport system permease protein
MVLPIYTVLSKIDPKLYEAAHDLGANRFETFMRVTLPLSITGVLSGITMVLLPAATTLVIPKYLGGGRYLIGNLIEDRFLKNGNWGYGSAIAIILSVIIMIMVYLTKKLDKNPEVDHD